MSLIYLKPYLKWCLIGIVSGLIGFGIGMVYIKFQPTTRLPARQGSNPVGESPLAASNSGWKTYTNSNYSIEVQYPDRFNLNNELPGDYYYENIGLFRSQYEETISISVIKDIDIYDQAKAIDVATREIMDAGYKYEVIETKIGNYAAAITTIDDQNILSLSITIAHPTKNLFTVLNLPRNLSKTEFDQILATFKFTDTNDAVCQTSSDCPAGYFCNTFDQTCNQELPD